MCNQIEDAIAATVHAEAITARQLTQPHPPTDNQEEPR